MNQAIIINDDYEFNHNKQYWQCSAMLSGEKVIIIINSSVSSNELTQAIKFDWEYVIEEWFEENEPNNNTVEITIK
ncbi:hypothetical protein [Pseudocolwellia agarivorans]|uniref:hypothetical protein n=1 Tax=Pseudocolwellia agarivorans TaxID=1911682 RepID=UPI000984E80D|nr:hypothetical protein [Pseudocolwellia agarivorans]